MYLPYSLHCILIDKVSADVCCLKGLSRMIVHWLSLAIHVAANQQLRVCFFAWWYPLEQSSSPQRIDFSALQPFAAQDSRVYPTPLHLISRTFAKADKWFPFHWPPRWSNSFHSASFNSLKYHSIQCRPVQWCIFQSNQVQWRQGYYCIGLWCACRPRRRKAWVNSSRT